MQTYLKIKIKSLAAEARIIRHEELKTNGRRRFLSAVQAPAEKVEALNGTFIGLHRHRTFDVRNEARAAQLAYGFLRQRPYRTLESKGFPPSAIRTRAMQLAIKYGPSALRLQTEALIAEWLKA